MPDSGLPACQATPTFLQQEETSASDFMVAEVDFNVVASLGYTLIPEVSAEDARCLLHWVLSRWCAKPDEEAEVLQNPATLAAFSQVEYFFFGTDNGQVFMAPLLPPHFLRALVQRSEAAAESRKRWDALAEAIQSDRSTRATASLPYQCGPRRLLHRHAREEPVTVLAHHGTLVASANGDGFVALSFFHPEPRGICLLRHERPVRCLILWEGGRFVDRVPRGPPGSQWEAWRQTMGHAERTSIYLFTGDDQSVVRLWRVDVLARSYSLFHVFVCTPHLVGLASSLDIFRREDQTRCTAARESAHAIFSLAIDSDTRLLAGTERGIFVWRLDRLSWRSVTGTAGTAAETVDPAAHALAWDEENCMPLSVSCDEGAAVCSVRLRAARLVNQHVWVREVALLQSQLRDPTTCEVSRAPSRWKPKYTTIANGAAIAVVSNEVSLPNAGAVSGLGAVLHHSIATLSYEEGQLRNDVHFPLACVEPVVYPHRFLPTGGSAIFALQVVQHDGRLVSAGSDGKTVVWLWSTSDETYIPTVLTQGHPGHRGLGRQLCVLRSPDAFITSGYDDGIVKEWAIYNGPDIFVRCERRFTMVTDSDTSAGGGQAASALAGLTSMLKGKKEGLEDAETADAKYEDGVPYDDGTVAGVGAAVLFAPFAVLFLVGVFDSTIQAYSRSEVCGCEPPLDYIYNGFKTVHLPFTPPEVVFRPDL